jgi:hypothetical protein
LLKALGPIESSTLLPLRPLTETTTPLFSLTSRSLLPRHLTTTLMLVSSPASWSKSRSFRFAPALGGALGDRARDVLAEEIDSAGDSDRPKVDPGAFGLGGGRIEPRFAGCGRAGITMMKSRLLQSQLLQRNLCGTPKVLKLQTVWTRFLYPR